MAGVPTMDKSLSQIFPVQFRGSVLAVYKQIPGSFAKFLQATEVVKVINFDDTFNVGGELGTEKNKSWDKFRMLLRGSVDQKLKYHGVTGIKPEEISDFISQEYLKLCPKWASRGQNLSGIVQLNRNFADEYSRYINAYIYARITEECEDNFFNTNKYKYTYYVNLDLKGIVINEQKAAQCGQLISQGVPEAIAFIEEQCSLTWEGFMKK